jgi:hypothetical protein
MLTNIIYLVFGIYLGQEFSQIPKIKQVVLNLMNQKSKVEKTNWKMYLFKQK